MRKMGEYDFDVLEVVKMKKMEEYLYMTHEELFRIKLKLEEDICRRKEIAMEKLNKTVEFDGTEYIYFEPDNVYNNMLEKSAVISYVLRYKYINLERNSVKGRGYAYGSEKKTRKTANKSVRDLIIHSIQNNPHISYFELIDLKSENGKVSYYLERLIHEEVLCRQRSEDGEVWNIKKCLKNVP